MSAKETSAISYRFGMFELDLTVRQLRKNGYRLRLQEQPMRVLECLLERSGELVTREELRQRIWPKDTFVEFDDNLNTAVQKIRQALGDDAGSPRFIETMPKQGYRFIAPLEGSPRPGTAEALPQPQPPARHPRIAWVITAVALAALPAAFLLRPRPVLPTISLEVYPPEGNVFSAASLGDFAISPDGSKLAFTAGPKQAQRVLWIRPLESAHAASLSGTEGAQFPFWAPDGRRLGFFARGKLWTLDLENGQQQALCDVGPGGFLGATWNQQDVILFSAAAQPLQRVSAWGGTPVAALPLNESRKELDQRHPSFLPDGRHFLYSSRGEKAALFAGALDDGKERFLADANAGRYLGSPARANGYLFYLSMPNPKRSLMALPFDPGKVRPIGEPIPVDEPVAAGPSFSTSLNGVLAYRKSVQFLAQLTWIDREGKRLGTVGEPVRPVDGPRLSGNQQMVAFSRDSIGNQSDIWLTHGARNVSTRFTFAPGANRCAVWSPDDKYVAWTSTREGKSFLMRREANGQGKDEIVLDTDICPQSFSPDGRWIAGTRFGAGGADIWFVPANPETGLRKAVPFLVTANAERTPQFSPDGKWIAYVSTESARAEVYVEPAPEAVKGISGRSGKWAISDAGGSSPRWRGDGKELYYVTGGSKLMAVSVESKSGSLQISKPKQLFETQFYPEGKFLIPYDVASDGRRFLVSTLVDADPGLIPITIVVNWRPGIR